MEFMTAGRYARALFEAAAKSGQTSQINDELDRVQAHLKQDDRTRFLLTSPMILSKAKEKIASILADPLKLSPLTQRFLTLLAVNGRMGVLQQIVSRFSSLNDDRENRARVTVTLATAGGKPTLDALTTALQGVLRKTVVCDLRVDPEMLGGIHLRIGDTIIDGSLRYQLQHFREAIASRRLPS